MTFFFFFLDIIRPNALLMYSNQPGLFLLHISLKLSEKDWISTTRLQKIMNATSLIWLIQEVKTLLGLHMIL